MKEGGAFAAKTLDDPVDVDWGWVHLSRSLKAMQNAVELPVVRHCSMLAFTNRPMLPLQCKNNY